MSLYTIVEKGVESLSKDSKSGDIVHFTTVIEPNLVESIDGEFSVGVKGALNMKRVTEYCQWRQLQHESCETCTRKTKHKDGSSSNETYKCNCYAEYSYVKGWYSHLILSMTFDQPAAHHNPMRDPFPSKSFSASKSIVQYGNAKVDLPSTLIQNTKANYHKVIWTPSGAPPPPNFFTKYFGSFFQDKNRYEQASELRGTENSIATQTQNFMYVDQGGYFFSPYTKSNYEQYFKYFMQFMEGTLFDFQFGDLINSCTPGDIRVSYKVQDPHKISILGQISNYDMKTKTFRLSSKYIKSNEMNQSRPIETTSVGFIHEGENNVEEMIQKEQYDSFITCAFVRLLLLCWAIPVSVMIGTFLGKDVLGSSIFVKFSAVSAVWFFSLALVWIIYWGVCNGPSYSIHDKQIVGAFTSSVIFGTVALNHSNKQKKKV